MLKEIRQQIIEGKTFLQFGFLKGLGQGLAMLCPLIVAKFFSKELFASYSLAKMAAFFFAMVLINSFQIGFVVFANQEKSKTGKINKTFTSQLLFLACSIFISSIVMFVFSKQIAAFANVKRFDLLFVQLGFVGLALKAFICNLFMATDQKIKSAVAEFIFGLASMVFIFMFFFLDQINLQTVFLIYPMSAVVVWLVLVRAIDFKLFLPLKISGSHILEMIHFGKWPFFGLTAVYLINWGYNFILRFYNVGLEEIGDCNLAFQIFKGVVTLASIAGLYFLPFVSQNINNKAKMEDFLKRKRIKVLVLGVFLITVLAVLAPAMLSLIYGDKYSQANIILILLLVACVCHLYNTFYHAIYNAVRLNRYIHILDVIQAVITLGLNLLLIPIWGLYGVAVSTVAGFVIRTVVMQINFTLTMKNRIGFGDAKE